MSGALLRIGELARRAGIPPATLRAWERRYGIVEPQRTESGYRLYSERDERRLKRMIELITGGAAPAEAAKRVLATTDPPPAADAVAGSAGDGGSERVAIAERLRAELLERLLAFDEPGAHRSIDAAIASFSAEALLDDVILPVLRRTGELWHAGELSIGDEHFVSSLIRGRILALARGWGSGEGPLALLACPPHEQHDLGLVAFGLVLRQRGWRIAFLGADTPLAEIAAAAARLAPRVVVLPITAPQTASSLARGEPPAIGAPLAIGGAAAGAALAEHLGATLLDGGIGDAAAQLDATVRGP